MRTEVNEILAPTRGMEREPISEAQSSASNVQYSTLPVIGGSQAGPVHGWESVQPKRSNKPDFLLAARQAEDDAWADYLDLVDTLEVSGKWDHGSVEDAWDVYEDAKRKAASAYKAYCQGHESLPIPF